MCCIISWRSVAITVATNCYLNVVRNLRVIWSKFRSVCMFVCMCNDRKCGFFVFLMLGSKRFWGCCNNIVSLQRIQKEEKRKKGEGGSWLLAPVLNELTSAVCSGWGHLSHHSELLKNTRGNKERWADKKCQIDGAWAVRSSPSFVTRQVWAYKAPGGSKPRHCLYLGSTPSSGFLVQLYSRHLILFSGDVSYSLHPHKSQYMQPCGHCLTTSHYGSPLRK